MQSLQSTGAASIAALCRNLHTIQGSYSEGGGSTAESSEANNENQVE